MRRNVEFKKNVRVLLVDDNFDHLAGIRELIELESNFDIIATATNANIAISLVKKYRPDVVLMDINMPEKDGLNAIQEIERLDLGVKVIALTAYDNPDLVYRAMKVGAKGYILKTMASAQLIYCVEEVANGKFYMPTGIATRFFEQFQLVAKQESGMASGEDNLLSFLTQREDEVLELLTQGDNYKDVAQKLFISETTVKTHVNNIFQKLQVRDRTQAVLYAINNGFANKRRMKIAV